MTEYKLLTGKSRDRKRFGAMRYDRIPEELTGEIILNGPKDYMLFLPVEKLPETFTGSELAKYANIPKRYISYVTGLLKLMGVIERLPEKRGNSYIYRVTF